MSFFNNLEERMTWAFFKSAFLSLNGIIALLLAVVLNLIYSIDKILAFYGGENNGFQWSPFAMKILISTIVFALIIRMPSYFISQIKTISEDINKRINDNNDAIKNDQKKLEETIQNSLSDYLKTIEENNEEIKKEQHSIKDNIQNSLSDNLRKIDRCPRMTAFYTENGSLKRRLDSMGELEPNARWMMSMFISKLLAFHFDSFTVKMDTQQYSLFSEEVMRECRKSVFLTGSMRPSTWLNEHADKDQKNVVELYFNNITPIREFPIKKDNDFQILNKCDVDKRIRIVCLSPEDMYYLFISERNVDTYFSMNNSQFGVETFFKTWQDSQKKKMKPLKYEYALYDNVLLFKFDKIEGTLTVINGNSAYENSENSSEFTEVQSFFKNKRDEGSSIKGYSEIILEIQKQKIRLLRRINETKLLPHKFSYLYTGAQLWVNFTKEKTKYGISSTIAIGKAIKSFFKEKMPLNIVEIGAGSGNKITAVCDAIGTDNIESYTIVDISSSLINNSIGILGERISKNKCKSVVLDCCLRANHSVVRDLTKDKTVLILSNSTLFMEDGFNWESFNQAKQILLSIDIVSDLNDTYNDLIKARKLFLSPLKIFEIPIVDSLIDKFSSYLFSYKTMTISGPFIEFCVYFNLKFYLELLSCKDTEGNNLSFDDIADEISNEVDRRKIVGKIEEYWKTSEPDLQWANIDFEYISDNKTLSDDYLNERKSFFEQKELKVLSCLKYAINLDENQNVNDKKVYKINNEESSMIKEYFNGLGYDVKAKAVNEQFVGFLLTPIQ